MSTFRASLTVRPGTNIAAGSIMDLSVQSFRPALQSIAIRERIPDAAPFVAADHNGYV